MEKEIEAKKNKVMDAPGHIISDIQSGPGFSPILCVVSKVNGPGVGLLVQHPAFVSQCIAP